MNRRGYTWFFAFIAVAISLAFVWTYDSRSVIAEDAASLSWVDSIIPQITKVRDLTVEEHNAGGSKTNFPCVYEDVHTWGSPWMGIGKVEYTSQGCTLPVDGGKFDVSNNAVIPQGVGHIQRLKDDTLDRLTFFPAANSSKLAMISNSYNLFYGGTPTLYLIDDWKSTFTNYSVDSYQNVTRQPSKPYDFILKYANGDPVYVRSHGMSFSANGTWLVIGVPNKSHVLINTETKQVLPFSTYMDSSYAIHSAVSNDGRYIVMNKPFDGLYMYDTQRCQSDQGEMVSRNCASREVSGLLKDFTGKNDLRVSDLNFIGAANTLQAKVAWLESDGVTWKYAIYRMRLPNTTPDKYLALGDSFSSGEGAFDYIEATDMFVSEDEYNVCHVSRKSYPYLLQQNLQADWFHSVACSGAETKDVEYDDTELVYANKNQSQSKLQLPTNQVVLDSYKTSMIPGYVPQAEFVIKHTPSVATVSLGGNDVEFANMISACIFNKGLNQTCFWGREERESKANEIDQKISAWSTTFVDIKNSLGGPEPRLYVIGYPKILNPDGVCGYNVPLQSAEIQAADKLVDYLNAAVKVAADAAGVRYVDTSDAFTRNGDYRLCSVRFDFAVNGLDMRNLIGGCGSAIKPKAPACSESFHPNELGHKLMAQTILSKTVSLTQDMPQNSNSTANLIDKRMSFVGDVAITLQNHRITYRKDIAPALIAKGEKIQINLPKSHDDLPAKPDTVATATTHSTPIVLGQLPIAADGTISGEVTLPSSIETGYHRLIVSYTDIADNIVEKYAYFYAAHSMTDWDGDGINNDSDPCVSVIQGGVDQDADGIDDACDSEYVRSAQDNLVEDSPGITLGAKDVGVTSTEMSSSLFGIKKLRTANATNAEEIFVAQNSNSDFHFSDQSSTTTDLSTENFKQNNSNFNQERNDNDDKILIITTIVVLTGVLGVTGLLIARRNGV